MFLEKPGAKPALAVAAGVLAGAGVFYSLSFLTWNFHMDAAGGVGRSLMAGAVLGWGGAVALVGVLASHRGA